MANPSKAKGTGGEVELLGLLNERGFRFSRTAPTTLWDLEQQGTARVWPEQPQRAAPAPITALATRPDRGQWLVTLPLRRFMDLLAAYEDLNADSLDLVEGAVRWRGRAPVRIEVKRHARFAHHSIFEQKFGGKA